MSLTRQQEQQIRKKQQEMRELLETMPDARDDPVGALRQLSKVWLLDKQIKHQLSKAGIKV
jgi:hypothetical protein